jgi:hypothetical protein
MMHFNEVFSGADEVQAEYFSMFYWEPEGGEGVPGFEAP